MWNETACIRPYVNSKVIWQDPSGQEHRGVYAGGVIWYPEGSSMYIYYTPVRWKYQ